MNMYTFKYSSISTNGELSSWQGVQIEYEGSRRLLSRQKEDTLDGRNWMWKGLADRNVKGMTGYSIVFVGESLQIHLSGKGRLYLFGVSFKLRAKKEKKTHNVVGKRKPWRIFEWKDDMKPLYFKKLNITVRWLG